MKHRHVCYAESNDDGGYVCDSCGAAFLSPPEAAALRAKLAEAEAKLPCGHPKACEEDDQCCLPEHRYCGYCHALNCNKAADWQKAAEKFMDERDAALKRATDAEIHVKAERTHTATLQRRLSDERALADQLAKAGSEIALHPYSDAPTSQKWFEAIAAYDAARTIVVNVEVGTNSTIKFGGPSTGEKTT